MSQGCLVHLLTRSSHVLLLHTSSILYIFIETFNDDDDDNGHNDEEIDFVSK